MKLETFFEKFDQFADAPDAVAKMRELVLNFAVTGKLSEQMAGDAPVSELVGALSAAKALRVKNGKRGATMVFPPESVVNCPVHAPAHWAWVPLNEIGAVSGGMTPSKDKSVFWDGDMNWFSSKDIKSDELTESELKITHEATEATGLQVYSPGCLVIVARSGILKRTLPVSILRVEGTVNQDLKVLSPFVSGIERYLQIMLRGMTRFILTELVKTGMTVQSLKYEEFKAQPFPLPPLAEQQRIVAKVHELMALCDRLEAQQQERETRHAALARASLVRFAGASTPANLPFLFHPSYAIPPADLRKSILTLAVQGKLVAQDPNDEPAEVTFPGLKAQTGEESDVPYQWVLCSYRSLTTLVTSGSRGWKEFYSEKGSIFVRTQNIKTDRLVLEDVAYVDLPKSAEGMRSQVLKDDLLITITGSNVTKAARVETQIPEAYVSQHIALTRPRWSKMSEWLHLCLISPGSARGTLERLAYGDKPGLNLNNIRDLVLPLPPLAEQRRIVAKVEQLMALVDALETQLAASRTTAANILSTLVAKLTGAEKSPVKSSSDRNAQAMKRKAASTLKPRSPARPSTALRITLRRFAMSSKYRSLEKFDCSYHSSNCESDETSPICLVGLNGSGKSNLIEAIADAFCFLELINLPWKKLESSSSNYRANRHQFEIEYTIEDARGVWDVRIRKTKKRGADFFTVSPDGQETLVTSDYERLSLLPRRIIGYSSGLNETVSHPFLRTRTIYSEEVREAAPPEGAPENDEHEVADTRTLYMDYESNAAIIICNYIFGKPSKLKVIEEFTRVNGVASFGIHFSRKLPKGGGDRNTVRLTSELKTYLKSFTFCAGVQYDQSRMGYDLKFTLNPETVRLFRQEFGTAERLFMAMHKWSLLNALVLSKDQREVYLRADITKGALERPPSVPPSDRVFNIVDLKLKLSNPQIEIDYSGLSDGEHQFIQVFGTALLFSEPGTLFLFDEPESHFNPEWRTRFNSTLNSLPNGSSQEYIISTHSPFIVSGSRKGNVYKFTRNGASVRCEPIAFETYGASFDVLLKKLFSVDSLIDESARADLEGIIKRGNVKEMQDAVLDFAESREKRRLYEAIIEREEKEI